MTAKTRAKNGKVEAEEIDVDALLAERLEANKAAFLEGYNQVAGDTGLTIGARSRMVAVSEDVYKIVTHLVLQDAKGNVVDVLEKKVSDGAQ